MTNREELIEHLARIMTAADCASDEFPFQDTSRAAAIVAADWRPAPTGDVIEAVSDMLDEHVDDYAGDRGVAARQLADAGLLATPPDESWAALMALLDKHWPEDIFPTKIPRSGDGRDTGPTIVGLLRWIDRLQDAQ